MPMFLVSDSHCDACVRSMTHAVQDLDPKATLHADLTTKLVRIETTAAADAVQMALGNAGFSVERA